MEKTKMAKKPEQKEKEQKIAELKAEIKALREQGSITALYREMRKDTKNIRYAQGFDEDTKKRKMAEVLRGWAERFEKE